MNHTSKAEVKALLDSIPEPTHLPTAPHIMSAIAPSGAGKTTIYTKMLQAMQSKSPQEFDHVVLISPSGFPDPDTDLVADGKWAYMRELGFVNENHMDFNRRLLTQLVQEQDARKNEWFEYLKDKKDFERIIAEVNKMEDQDVMKMWVKTQFKPPEPPKLNGKVLKRYPQTLLIFDDVGTVNDKYLSDFVCRSRHNNCSIAFLVQYHKMLPPAIRGSQNFTLIFKTRSDKWLKDIGEEIATSDMSPDEFADIFRMLPERSDFLAIDAKQTDEALRYRVNLNIPLHIFRHATKERQKEAKEESESGPTGGDQHLAAEITSAKRAKSKS
jgi:hypothetical protein